MNVYIYRYTFKDYTYYTQFLVCVVNKNFKAYILNMTELVRN